ncbi:MAG: flagellar export chaperone FliS [Gammaproteobacteria bacterium]|nr:flagellar export chaperone FliS [Gammaproteobacteria bacterium]MBU1415461.1 flagellar export chaperone FliS [Gammaproteobacteria bacterium]
MNTAAAISAYNNVGIETAVMSADPHKLIAMLFDGALLAITRAREETLTEQTAAKGHSISKAIAIIGEGLNASLDHKVGGKLAEDLSALYAYMVRRLVDANLNNDVSTLDEVSGLLMELKDAWDAIRPQVVGAADSGSRPPSGTLANG